MASLESKSFQIIVKYRFPFVNSVSEVKKLSEQKKNGKTHLASVLSGPKR